MKTPAIAVSNPHFHIYIDGGYTGAAGGGMRNMLDCY
jgi:hypothetical protein